MFFDLSAIKIKDHVAIKRSDTHSKPDREKTRPTFYISLPNRSVEFFQLFCGFRLFILYQFCWVSELIRKHRLINKKICCSIFLRMSQQNLDHLFQYSLLLHRYSVYIITLTGSKRTVEHEVPGLIPGSGKVLIGFSIRKFSAVAATVSGFVSVERSRRAHCNQRS